MYLKPTRTTFTLWGSLFLLSFFMMHAPAMAQSGDEQDQRRQGGGMGQLNFSTGGFGPFYYFEELGMNVALPQLVQTGVIDPETYEIGPGDMLTLDFSGEFSGTMKGLLVNSSGKLVIPRIGQVDINGLLIPEAQQQIETFVRETYPDTELSISVDRPRRLNIHVAGQVPFPGAQVLRPQTRLDQAVFPAFFEMREVRDPQGINPFPVLPLRYPASFIESDTYSLRKIEIHRADGSTATADLLSYFYTGDLSANPVVKEGDIVHISRMEEFSARITISGGVQRNQHVEYREDDTLGRIVALAGGFREDAELDNIKIFRRGNGQVEQLTVDASRDGALDQPLMPNDRIIVPYDMEARDNYIASVNGEVELPGSFPIEDGETTVYDLIELAGGFTERALPNAAVMVRTRPARTETGNRQPFDPQRILRTSDQLQQGFEYIRSEAEMNRNEVYVDLTDEAQMRSVKVYNGDRLTVPRDDETIFMMGQVRNPGYYAFTEGRSVRDYVEQAGGFTIPAEEERIFIIKAGNDTWYRPHETELNSGDVIFIDRTPYDELTAQRTYDIQQRQIRNSNIQLIMTGLSTITGIITTYVAITR